MKVAVSATGPGLDSTVDPRFGRCSMFVVVDTEGGGIETLDHTHATRSGGAGIQAAQLMAQKGVKAVLTGSCGPNAHETLKAAGIEVYLGCTGSVAEAIASYQQHRLAPADAPNVQSHAGMKAE